MKIIGIDPGSRITGYGVIDKNSSGLQFVTCGVVKSSPKIPFPERLKELHDGLCQVIEKFNPQYASVEDIFFARNPSSALKLGQVRGALIIAAMGNDLIVKEFTAKQVKQTVAGYGQASKSQIQHMVRVTLNLTSSPSEDAADALANALCLATHLDTY